MKRLRSRLLLIAVLAVGSALFLLPRNVTQRLYDPAAGGWHDTTLRRVPIELGLDLRGGTHIALEVDQSRGTVADCRDAIRRAERVVRARVEELGTTERVVQVVGDCRLVVELPGASDPARARAIVQRAAYLEFRLTDSREEFRRALPAIDAALRRAGVTELRDAAGGDPVSRLLAPDSSPAPADAAAPLSSLLFAGRMPGEFLVAEPEAARVESLLARPEARGAFPRGIELVWGAPSAGSGPATYRALYAVATKPIVTGEDVQKAVAGVDPLTNSPEVRFELTRGGGRRFAGATGRNIGNYLAILLDGRIQGDPAVIREQIGGSGRIEMGGKSLEEANDLALVLRAGALPVPLVVVAQHTIGPSLGQDSIHDGVRASVLAVAFVILVMGIYYRFAGALAIGALGLYVLYSAGGLAVFGFALSLPGLAGFALAIGMAVDANVLIFERIREELATGKPPGRAVHAGFRNAMSAIVDSNVTTALTALVLYAIGTGPVRGFAVTLLVGLAASMFSAVFVTRTFFLVWLKARPALRTIPMRTVGFLSRAKLDFLAVRRWAYGLSMAFIVPGILWLALQGVTYSIEFTGGTMVHVETAEGVGADQLRGAMRAAGLPGAEIQRFGSDREYVIRARLDETTAGDGGREAVRAAVDTALERELGAGTYEVGRSEAVSPRVGAELQQKALIATAVSFATTLIYLAFRFEWRFGLAAVLATAHDILATVAFIRYLDLEVSLVVVAAILTVLGYSLNDTIVIFDRVRDHLRRRGNRTFAQVLNAAINETLPRTVLTGGTTIATALVLSFLAGTVIKPFALVMTFGIVVGTFSSIFVAPPILHWVVERVREPRAVEAELDRGLGFGDVKA
jgi:protein-export membrane protein SecD/preprotein translocase SecF subunit